jgi:hypothetical protein
MRTLTLNYFFNKGWVWEVVFFYLNSPILKILFVLMKIIWNLHVWLTVSIRGFTSLALVFWIFHSVCLFLNSYCFSRGLVCEPFLNGSAFGESLLNSGGV